MYLSHCSHCSRCLGSHGPDAPAAALGCSESSLLATSDGCRGNDGSLRISLALYGPVGRSLATPLGQWWGEGAGADAGGCLTGCLAGWAA